MTIIAQLESCRLQGLRGGGCECSLLFEALNKERPASPEQTLLPLAPSWVFCAVCCCVGSEVQSREMSKEMEKSLNTHISISDFRAWSNLCEWNTSLPMARGGRR